MLSPGLISYQRSMRTASRHPSSDKLPSITIGPLARVMEYVSPLVDSCALAEVATTITKPSAAAGHTNRFDISSLRRDGLTPSLMSMQQSPDELVAYRRVRLSTDGGRDGG